jgi:hypothetical protein
MRSAARVVLLGLVAFGGCIVCVASVGTSRQPEKTGATPQVAAPPPASKPDATRTRRPALGQNPLITNVIASRDDSGGLLISGQTTLPEGTRLMIDLRNEKRMIGQTNGTASSEDPVTVVSRGFKTPPFTRDGKPWPAATYHLEILSFFNGAWEQPPSVMAFAGDDGRTLPGSGQVQPDDKEFPTAARHISARFDVKAPPIPSGVEAIEHVKAARLNVKGHGWSSETVGAGVAFLEKPSEMSNLQWSSERSGKRWVVTLDFVEGASKPGRAQWAYEPETGRVSYLDPTAKIFSWIPKD